MDLAHTSRYWTSYRSSKVGYCFVLMYIEGIRWLLLDTRIHQMDRLGAMALGELLHSSFRQNMLRYAQEASLGLVWT